ncbi:Ran-specific GTPase-activating protein [Mactra antiquata]
MATETNHTDEVESPDIHFEPIVQLAPVKIASLEEEEEELIKLRAKLYRFDSSVTPSEWKERGTGTVKLLKHKTSKLVRVLMRRDKTLKLCANHYVQPEMELTPNCGSDKAWVWTTPADYSDGEAKAELLAIKFGNAENAQKFKEKFVEAQQIMKDAIPKHNASIESSDDKCKTEEDTKKDGGDGDKSEEKEETKSDSADTNTKEADSVAEGLENLTVKDNDNMNKENDSTNKTDDEKVRTGDEKDLSK